MTYLRLTSSQAKQNFMISARSLIGYCQKEISDEMTLYTPSYTVNLSKDNWDNWDEFIEQVKSEFVETEDF
jgi:hypothetical protein